MTSFLTSESWLIERIGWILIHSLWQIGIAGAIIAVLMTLLRRRTAKLRYAVLMAGLATVLLSPALTAMFLRDQSASSNVLDDPRLVSANSGSESGQSSRFVTTPEITTEGEVAVVSSNYESMESAPLLAIPSETHQLDSQSNPPVPEVSFFEQIDSKIRPWLPWIVTAWTVGLFLFSLRTAVGFFVIRKLRRNGTSPVSDEVAACFLRVLRKFELRTPVRLLQSAIVSAPVVVGWLRPVILLPLAVVNGLTVSQIEAIIAHELAHVRRFDAYFVVLQAAFETLFFFHPVTWWISNRIRIEREFCCDDLAVSLMSNRMDYSRALLAISELKQQSNLLVLGADGGSLMTRVQRLFGQSDASRSSLWASVAFVTLTMLIGSLAWMQSTNSADASPASAAAADEPETSTDHPVFIVRGKVLMPDGSLATDAEIVSSQEENNGAVKEIVSDGVFEIHTNDLPEGRYTKFRTRTGSHVGDLWIAGNSLRKMAKAEQVVTLALPRIVTAKITNDGRAVIGAKVLADDQIEYTDSAGVAQFALPADETPYTFTAWSETGLMGGLIPSRVPNINASSSSFDVELYRSKKVRVRAVDTSKSPVKGLSLRYYEMNGTHFEVTVCSAPFSLKATDENGEAVFEVPHLLHVATEPHRYVNLPEKTNWIIEKTEWLAADSTFLVQLKPKQKRVPVEFSLGGLASATPGVLVELNSHEGENSDETHVIHARTNEFGNLVADILPGSTYVAFVDDEELVSNTWHGEILSMDGSQLRKPDLRVQQGVPIEVKVTQGTDHAPVRNAWVLFESTYNFEYEARDGQVHRARTGRRFRRRTNEFGHCVVSAAPGPLNTEVWISLGEWEKKQTVMVPEKGPLSVTFHRPIADSLTLNGLLKRPDGETNNIEGSKIRIVTMDNDSRREWTAVSDAEGKFSASITSGRVAIVASSPDDQFFGCSIADVGTDVIEVPMHSTVRFGGHVLGDHDAPIEGAEVRIIARRTDREVQLAEGMADFNRKHVDSLRTSVKTDASGYFEFPHVPQLMELTFFAKWPGDADDTWMSERWLEPGEEFLPPIFRLGSETPAAAQPLKPIETVMTDMMQDCRLSHTHALIAVKGAGDLVQQFVTKSVFDYDKLREVVSYLPKSIDGQRAREIEERRIYFEKRNWPFPTENQVLLIALNEQGSELGQIMVDVTQNDVATAATAEFVKKHVPPEQDAKARYEAALAEAKKSNRRVWAVVSQTRCAPCFVLSRWMESQKTLLEKDYVIFKFDNVRDLHGLEILESLGFAAHGVPCHAILDADGHELANSIGPLGNIGSPGGPDGIKQIRKMLTASRQHLTDDEVNSIVLSIPTE